MDDMLVLVVATVCLAFGAALAWLASAARTTRAHGHIGRSLAVARAALERAETETAALREAAEAAHGAAALAAEREAGLRIEVARLGAEPGHLDAQPGLPLSSQSGGAVGRFGGLAQRGRLGLGPLQGGPGYGQGAADVAVGPGRPGGGGQPGEGGAEGEADSGNDKDQHVIHDDGGL